MTHTTATRNIYCSFNFCGWKVQRPSSRWLAHVRKQAGHKAERYCVTKWSRCVERLAWLCLHCSCVRRCFARLPASLLVNANSLRRNEAQRSEAEWVSCLFATFLEDGTCGTRRNVVSGNGTKYGWSERLLRIPFSQRFFLSQPSGLIGFGI